MFFINNPTLILGYITLNIGTLSGNVHVNNNLILTTDTL